MPAGPIARMLMKRARDAGKMGPEPPPDYPPTPLAGRVEEEGQGFLKEMSPMLIAALADIVSTEATRKSVPGWSESNPVIDALRVGGSTAPPLAVGNLLAALGVRTVSKKNPRLGKLLNHGQAAVSGTLAGQNFGLLEGGDDRLSVWNQGR